MTDNLRHVPNEKKIEILLAEYQTLRAEVLQRNTTLNQTIAAFGTLAVPIIAVGFTQSSLVGIVLLVAAPSTVFVTWLVVHRDTKVLAKRLRELEQHINEKAGEQLLRWESDRTGMYTRRLKSN